jgi:ketosteroid isomerase-like protein
MKTKIKANSIPTSETHCAKFRCVAGVIKTSAILSFALFLICSGKSNAQSLVETNAENSSAQKGLNPEQKKIIATFFQAVRERNHRKAVPLLADDITWYQPGHNQFSGVKKSAKEVFDLFRGFIRMSDSTLRLDSARVIGINGNNVACLLSWNASQPVGKVLQVNNIDIYTIVDGKIKTVIVYSEDQSKEDDFWGNP